MYIEEQRAYCTDCKTETESKNEDRTNEKGIHYTLFYNQCPKCDAIYTPHTGQKVTMDELVERTLKEIGKHKGRTVQFAICESNL